MDIRDRASAMRWWTGLTDFTAVNKWGYKVAIHLVICNVCDGRGHYVNPSIDANGIDPAEFDEDPEFREDYFSGVFDIRCELCWGDRVIPVPTRPEDIADLQADEDSLRNSLAIQESEWYRGGIIP